MAEAQPLSEGDWHFTLSRPGGLPVYVQAAISQEQGNWQLEFINDTEKLQVKRLQFTGDSLWFDMPVFETRFRLNVVSRDSLTGTLLKGTSGATQHWEVAAKHGTTRRIPGDEVAAHPNMTGRWSMQFRRADGSWRNAVGEFRQMGNKVTGTILNPSGDYRFLEGSLRGHHLYLTTFDGSHIYAFKAEVPNDSTISDGIFFSGAAPGDAFKAVKDAKAALPELPAQPILKPGSGPLQFSFPDADSNLVSLSDPRYHGKVVVVQLMGSWCPNCMDETKFLSEFYNKQTTKEVEMVALAYELSTDFHRSAASLRKFKERFGVQYPMLITGAKSADPAKAEKTLPQLTDIRFFPTTLFLDKQGRVREMHAGFYGPGAPEYYEAFKKKFYATLQQLLQE